MKKLRLLITAYCNRDCKGCCNRGWDLTQLKRCDDFSGYEEVMITGGEPMLFQNKVKNVADRIRKENKDAKIILYTAFVEEDLLYVMPWLDGVTLTLHTKEDGEKFKDLNELFIEFQDNVSLIGKSMRLNVFKGIDYGNNHYLWDVKDDIVWIKDCPLPVDEVFMRI